MVKEYNRKDQFYQKAKAEGFRSRAAYKLKELDQKYGLLRSGTRVVDLGAWPGGWLQVCAQKVGGRGKVVGIDLVEMDALPEKNVLTVTGDVRDDSSLTQALDFAGAKFDLVLSDMSPKHTGIKAVDNIATAATAELALWAANRLLKPGGKFAAKLFPSNDTELFVKSARPRFNKVVRAQLNSTRRSSREFYFVGFGFSPEEEMFRMVTFF